MSIATNLVRHLKLVSLQPLHPLIHLSTCAYCAGTGKYRGVVNKRWTSLRCTQCAGKGTVVCDDGGAA